MLSSLKVILYFTTLLLLLLALSCILGCTITCHFAISCSCKHSRKAKLWQSFVLGCHRNPAFLDHMSYATWFIFWLKLDCFASFILTRPILQHLKWHLLYYSTFCHFLLHFSFNISSFLFHIFILFLAAKKISTLCSITPSDHFWKYFIFTFVFVWKQTVAPNAKGLKSKVQFKLGQWGLKNTSIFFLSLAATSFSAWAITAIRPLFACAEERQFRPGVTVEPALR